MGPEEKVFKVHKHILCAHSPFFDTAFKKDWAESRTGSMPLADDDAEIFELYQQWLYRNKVFSRSPPEQTGQSNTEYDTLIRAYIFGEKVQDGHFGDAIIDALIVSVNTPAVDGELWFPTDATVTKAYEGTPTGSPLRRLMVDLHVHHGSERWIKENNNLEFLVDLTRGLLASRSAPLATNPTSHQGSSCNYHQHKKKECCYGHKALRFGSN